MDSSSPQTAGLYSAVVLDVDSKDLSAGISSPPLTFVDPAFLTAVRSLLTQDGVLFVFSNTSHSVLSGTLEPKGCSTLCYTKFSK